MAPDKTRPKRRGRMVPRDGKAVKVVRIGHEHLWFSDLYVQILDMPWIGLIGAIVALYLLTNFIFATVYYVNRDGIQNAHSFADMFFFSVQTMATIGYGHMVPVSGVANLTVTLEALWGFIFFAFIAGLSFTKFSKPTARVMFSNVAVISDYEGKPHLKIRLANQRTNRIVDAHVEVVLLHDRVTKEGFRMRWFYDLPLVRNHVPILQLTWTLLHPIDENSPLYGVTQEKLREQGDEIIVSISGHDETLSQTIHARHSYVADEIIYGAYFKDILDRRDDGVIEVNYDAFHEVGPPNVKQRV